MTHTVENSWSGAIAIKASAKVTAQMGKLAAMSLEHPNRLEEERLLAKLRHNASAASLNAMSTRD